jgi:uncharacterized small protein (TIGR04563 family)
LTGVTGAQRAWQTRDKLHRMARRTGKQNLYFSTAMLNEIAAEAGRLGHSFSWVVQRAWKIAVEEIKKIPSA